MAPRLLTPIAHCGRHAGFHAPGAQRSGVPLQGGQVVRSFRFVPTAFSAVALIAPLAGCGTTTSPTAVTPDTTAPSAPTSLSYALDRTGTTLTWAAGPNGNITSYAIYLYQPDPSRSTSY